MTAAAIVAASLAYTVVAVLAWSLCRAAAMGDEMEGRG